MTSFEFVMMMVSVVLSLGLTHLVSGYVGLIQPPGRTRFSVVHALWALTIFGAHIDMWLSLWTLRAVSDWSLLSIVMIFLGVVMLYIITVLITPKPASDTHSVDLWTFHMENRRRYLGVALVYAVWGSIMNVTLLSAETFGWANVTSLLPAIACYVVAIAFPQRWAQWLAALAAVAVQAVYFITFFADIRT